MKILHLSSARNDGGGERHLTDLVNALVRRGHEVSVACRPSAPFIRRLSSSQIVNPPLHPLFSFYAAQRLARFIHENGIDILHAHLARDYPLAALTTRLARKSAPVRLVLTRHVLFPLGKVHRRTFAQASRVIAVSEAVAEAIRAQEICPPEKISVIKNGIALEKLVQCSASNSFRQQLGARDNQILVGMSGELSRVKNQEDFLRAAASLAREHPNAMFLIAGEDNSRRGEYRNKLELMIREFDLNQRVKLLGWVEPVAPFLAALDVFVSASRSESFGLAIVEAMASGLPVISTATEGAKEIISNQQTGLLVPVEDAEALAAAIHSLINDVDARLRLGVNARAHTLANFSLERMITETEELYRAVINL